MATPPRPAPEPDEEEEEGRPAAPFPPDEEEESMPPAPPAASLAPNVSGAGINDRARDLRRGCGEYAAFQQKVWEILEDEKLTRREQRRLIQAEEMKLRGRVCCRGCRSVEHGETMPLLQAAD